MKIKSNKQQTKKFENKIKNQETKTQKLQTQIKHAEAKKHTNQIAKNKKQRHVKQKTKTTRKYTQTKN